MPQIDDGKMIFDRSRIPQCFQLLCKPMPRSHSLRRPFLLGRSFHLAKNKPYTILVSLEADEIGTSRTSFWIAKIPASWPREFTFTMVNQIGFRYSLAYLPIT